MKLCKSCGISLPYSGRRDLLAELAYAARVLDLAEVRAATTGSETEIHSGFGQARGALRGACKRALGLCPVCTSDETLTAAITKAT